MGKQAERGGDGIPIGHEASGDSRTELGVERVSTIPAGKGLYLPLGEVVVGRIVIAASEWAP